MIPTMSNSNCVIILTKEDIKKQPISYLALTMASAVSFTADGKSERKPFNIDCKEIGIYCIDVSRFGEIHNEKKRIFCNKICYVFHSTSAFDTKSKKGK